MNSKVTKTRNEIQIIPSQLKLAIVTPVYKNDPSALLNSIENELRNADYRTQIEFILVDDGSNQKELSDKLKSHINTMPVSSMLIEFLENQGRSAARNALIENSIAPFILFLDSDMLPDCPKFILKWLEFIERTSPTIAYGGFSMLQAPKDKRYDLARELASRIDCLNAQERNERGPVAVATSNLLVRRDIMEKVPFDNGFVGWGWEDVDWAFRANAAKYAVVHFENPATHLGLDEAKVILEKFKNAGPNFKHITSRHPQMEHLGSTRLAQIFSKIPFLVKFAPFVGFIANWESLPLKIRAKAARFWRVIWAANSLNT